MIEGNGKDLIGPKRCVVAAGLSVYHVIQVISLGEPEALVEGRPAPLGNGGVFLGHAVAVLFAHPAFDQLQGVVPECIDFHGFAAVRRDNPISDFCIHPGELISRDAPVWQPVLRVDADVEAGAADMMLDDVPQDREDVPQRGPVAAGLKVTVNRVKVPERRVGM